MKARTLFGEFSLRASLLVPKFDLGTHLRAQLHFAWTGCPRVRLPGPAFPWKSEPIPLRRRQAHLETLRSTKDNFVGTGIPK